MSDLGITVSLGYFFGVMGILIVIAYCASDINADHERLKDTISDLIINAENLRTKLFENGSAPTLTLPGYQVLQRSGLKSYIDAKKKTLLASLHAATALDPYELQRRAFRLFAGLRFEDVVAYHLNNFAFSNGVSPALLRRVGAIYLRDLAARRWN